MTTDGSFIPALGGPSHIRRIPDLTGGNSGSGPRVNVEAKFTPPPAEPEKGLITSEFLGMDGAGVLRKVIERKIDLLIAGAPKGGKEAVLARLEGKRFEMIADISIALQTKLIKEAGATDDTLRVAVQGAIDAFPNAVVRLYDETVSSRRAAFAARQDPTFRTPLEIEQDRRRDAIYREHGIVTTETSSKVFDAKSLRRLGLTVAGTTVAIVAAIFAQGEQRGGRASTVPANAFAPAEIASVPAPSSDQMGRDIYLANAPERALAQRLAGNPDHAVSDTAVSENAGRSYVVPASSTFRQRFSFIRNGQFVEVQDRGLYDSTGRLVERFRGGDTRDIYIARIQAQQPIRRLERTAAQPTTERKD